METHFTNPKRLNDSNMEMSPWDYYLAMRNKSWADLTEYEQERITLAACIILDDTGTVCTFEEVKEYLRINLPEIPESQFTPSDGVLGGFITSKLVNTEFYPFK